MTVYVDIVMIVNFTVDYLLLYLTSGYLNIHAAMKKLIFAACFGGFSAVVLTLFFVRSPIKPIISLVFLVFMCQIAFGKQTIKRYIQLSVVMYIFSFILCGFVSMIVSGLPKYEIGDYGLLLFLVSILAFFVLSKKITPVFASDMSTSKVNISIDILGKTHELRLLCDSGNVLRDMYTGIPVMLLSASCASSVLGSQIIDERVVERFRMRPMKIKTAAGDGICYVMSPDSVMLGNRQVKCEVGFVHNNASFSNCDGLFPSCLI